MCFTDAYFEIIGITKFDFLGYTFRNRRCRTKDGKLFMGFSPAVSDVEWCFIGVYRTGNQSGC